MAFYDNAPQASASQAAMKRPARLLVIGEPLVELLAEGSLVSDAMLHRRASGDVLTTASAAAQQGITTQLITRLSRDALGQGLLEAMTTMGVQWHSPRWHDPATQEGVSNGVIFRSRSNADLNAFVYQRKGSAASQMTPQDLASETFQGEGIVFSSGITMAISASARKTVFSAFQRAKAAGWTTAFDPNYRPALWSKPSAYLEAMSDIFPLTDVLLLSTPTDCRPLCHLTRHEAVLDYLGYQGVPLVVLKAGDEGCFLRFRGETMAIPAYWPEPIAPSVGEIDAVGAGDAFNGGFLAALAEHQSLLACAQRSVMTAGLYLHRQQGLAGLPSRNEMSRLLSPAQVRLPNQPRGF
ncbi:MAG: sugar kinase [Vampirovibrionales bacterium]|nr:sugar kinase [Vampirovibrionales bacterium]